MQGLEREEHQSLAVVGLVTLVVVVGLVSFILYFGLFILIYFYKLKPQCLDNVDIMFSKGKHFFLFQKGGNVLE